MEVMDKNAGGLLFESLGESDIDAKLESYMLAAKARFLERYAS